MRAVFFSSGENVFLPQLVMPGEKESGGMEIFSRVAEVWLRRLSTTSSFSSGANVQVEYTNSPPGARRLNAFSMSCFWR